jgi:uncharacterized protein YqhQ
MAVIALGVLVGRKPKFKRLFQFHGAEHAVVNTYEKTQKRRLEVGDVNPNEVLAKRCGSNFIAYYIVFSAIFYIGLGNTFSVAASFFMVNMVSYEFFNFVTKYKFLNFASRLGYSIQKRVVIRPHEYHLEAAVAAFNRLMKLEEKVDKTVC